MPSFCRQFLRAVLRGAVLFAIAAPALAQTGPPVLFVQPTYMVMEGAGVVTATVRLANDRLMPGFSVTGTIVALDDAFVLPPSTNLGRPSTLTFYDVSLEPVTFALDQTNIRAEVPIMVIADMIPESDETIPLQLVSFGHAGSTQQAAAVIIDDDNVVIGFQQLEYETEEDSGGFSVCTVVIVPLSTRPIELAYDVGLWVNTIPGSAAAGGDFTPINNQDVGPFSQMTRRQCFAIEITDNDVPEDNETFTLRLTFPPGTDSAQRAKTTIEPMETTVSIEDNEPMTIGFEKTTLTVLERFDTTGSACVTISEPRPDSAIDREFSLSLSQTDGTAPGSATSGLDYQLPATIGPFGPTTRSACIDVAIVDDDEVEGTETLNVRLGSAPDDRVTLNPASFVMTIIDDESLVDYSEDGRLIDVRTPEQLHAMRWDLDADGVPDDPAHATSYSAAFLDHPPDMGCSTATGCVGYTLRNDLDLGASRFGRGGGGAGWAPIGTGQNPYLGNFDGRGHVIRGLYIRRPSADYVGLFGRIGGVVSSIDRRIQNLGLLDADVTGNNRVGALAGRISTQTVVATIYAAGGLVRGNDDVGGLVGLLEDDLIAAYASVFVSGRNDVGGLAGESGGGSSRKLSASYAAGRVLGERRAGGLVGRHADSSRLTVEASYWDTLISGQSASALGVGTNTAALRTPTTYSGIYANWNVDVDGSTETGVDGADDPWDFGTSTQHPVLRYGGFDVSTQHAALPQPPLALGGAPPVVFERSTYSVVEGAGRAAVTVQASTFTLAAGRFSVIGMLEALDELTSEKTRYDVSTSTVSFVLDHRITRTEVLIPVIADAIPEDEKAVPLRLVVLDYADSTRMATLTITDDDDIGVGFERASYALDEGSSLSVCVAIATPTTAVAMEREFSLAVTTRPGSAGINDYTGLVRSFTFGDSTRSACLDLATTEDLIAEETEGLFLDVATPGALPEGLVINPAVAEATIADNDPITLGLVSSAATVVEGVDTSATVCVEIAAPAMIERADFSLAARTTDGSASAGSDYAAPTPPAIGPLGGGDRRACVRVGIIDDETAEPNETFRVFVAAPSTLARVVVARSSLTVTIRDNDLTDYSEDGRLIDVRRVEQLHAMRWDLNADGVADQPAYATSYSLAFPFAAPNLGCTPTCTGYALGTDLDLGASRFGRSRSSEGWLPIGAEDAPYVGDFDGRGRVLSGLYINRPSLDAVGLFGTIGVVTATAAAAADGSARRISNLGLIDVDVTGGDHVGSLAGVVSTGTVVVTTYASSGSVTGNTGVGGLAGLIGDDAIAVYARVSVSGVRDVGGLAGISDGATTRSLIASYAAGRVAGTSDAGGLVGSQDDTDTVAVADSYWDTFFSGQGTSALGVGTDTGSLQTPTTYGGIYARWNVDVDGDGEADDPWRFGTSFDYPVLRGTTANVARQLAIQLQAQLRMRIVLGVTGVATVAEGAAATYTVVASSLVPYPVTLAWEVVATSGAGVATANDFRAAATTTLPLVRYPTGTATIMTGATGTSFLVYTLSDGVPEDPETFRVVVRVEGFGGRIIIGEGSSATITAIEFNDGINYDLDADGLIEVTTLTQLSAMRYDENGAGLAGVSTADAPAYREAYPFFDQSLTCPSTCTGYELQNDLDFNTADATTRSDDVYWNDGQGWEPFDYAATFDGNGHVISNLYIYRERSETPNDYLGLFRELKDGGVLRGVGMVDAYIESAAEFPAGALLGQTRGFEVTTITSSYAVGGSVNVPRSDVGGLVGALRGGNMVACYAAVEVTGSVVGSLVGRITFRGRIVASYGIGRVHPTVALSQTDQYGALVGNADPGICIFCDVVDSYYDPARTGWSHSGGGTSKTASNLLIPVSYDDSAGNDGVAIYAAWNVDVDDDGIADDPWDFGTVLDYPVLRGTSASIANVARQFALQPQAVLPAVVTAAASVAEGGSVEYTVSAPATLPYATTVHWSVGATNESNVAAPADFADAAGTRLAAFPSGTAVIQAGSSRTTFSVYVFDDQEPEYAETFVMRVGGAADAGARAVLRAEISSVIEFSDGIDYDHDNDTLIDVATTQQLSAIRYDLHGRGLAGVSEDNEDEYSAAFAVFDALKTCPTTCTGYELMNDLHLASVVNAGNWIPIGGGYSAPLGGGGTSWLGEPLARDRYEAIFEGNGHVIGNMQIRIPADAPRYDHVGLFGALGVSGTIRSTGLVDVGIDTGWTSVNAGGLAGASHGRIESSYVVDSSVFSGWGVGGLVGTLFKTALSTATVVASYAEVSVRTPMNGNRGKGGLIGGSSVPMGVAGKNVVNASYSIGSVEDTGSQDGGLVGSGSASADVQSSYFDRDRTAQTACCGAPAPSPDVAPRTSAQLRGPTTAAGTIYAGWERLNVDGVDQGMDGDLNDDAPWDFGSPFQYPVLVFGGDTDSRSAQRTAQHAVQDAVILTPVFAGGAATVSEGVTLSYAVSLPQALPPGVTASWSLAVVGTGIDAADFVGSSGGRVVIAPGASSASFSLAVAGDDGAEFAETFEVSLRDALLAGNTENGVLEVPTTALRTLIAANGVRQVVLDATASSATVAEGASATFVVRLGDAAGEALVVEYEIASVSEGLTPADLRDVIVMDRAGTGSVPVVALPVTGTVTLGEGGDARVSVRITDDDVPAELDDRFRLRLTRCSNCAEYAVETGVPSSFTVTIIDDDFMDYSSDDRLIDVRTPEQLHAIRWDLNGDGVADDPAYATSYRAAFPAPIENMGCATICTGYALFGDVDLAASRFARSSGSEGWSPIGAENAGYDADFDGRWYAITGLYIHRPTSDHVGLFARIGTGASAATEHRIERLGLVDADVTGNNRVGTLAGWISTNTVVTRIYAAGGSVAGGDAVGGLAGVIGDDVIAVYASVAVSGTSAVGGLAGESRGNSSRRPDFSYAAGRVTGMSAVGGLVGRDTGFTLVPLSPANYWDASFSGQNASLLASPRNTAALLAPTSYTGIYANWNVDVDGVPGADDPWDFGTPLDYPVLRGTTASVARQRALQLRLQVALGQTALSLTGAAPTVAEGGQAIYTLSASPPVIYPVTVFWRVVTASANGATADDFRADAMTTQALVTLPTGTATIQTGGHAMTFSVYVLADEVPEEMEAFRVVVGVVGFDGRVIVAPGSSAVVTTIELNGLDYDRDDDGLIEVTNRTQLNAIRFDLGGRGRIGVSTTNEDAYLEAFPFFDSARTCPCAGYELLGDMDLDDLGPQDWTPIGGGNTQAPWSEPSADYRYEAVFDGNGYAIRNMKIRSRDRRYDHVGLFGALGAAGTIRSVALLDAVVEVARNSENTGVLAGISYGKIASSYARDSSIFGGSAVGGLVGRTSGSAVVIASYADVPINAARVVGGLMGAMEAASVVSASYSIFTQSGAGAFARIGALLGERNGADAEIQASYSYGRGGDRCCGYGAPSPDNATRTSRQLRAPTTATGIYTGWDQLNVDGVASTAMGVMTLNDDAPWYFGSPFHYPVLAFGDAAADVARRTSQQEAQSAVRLMATFDGDRTAVEGTDANYVVSLSQALPAGVSASWSWVARGVSASGDDFGSSASGRVTIAPGAVSASFSVAVAVDGTAEADEVFGVSLGDARLVGDTENAGLGVPGNVVQTTIAANEFHQATVAAPATVDEGGAAIFTLRLSGRDFGAVVVDYEIVSASSQLALTDLESVSVVDRDGTRSERVTALPLRGSATFDADGVATVAVRVADDEVPLGSDKRFRLRLTGCPNCAAELSEIGVPAVAEVALRKTRFTLSAQVLLQGAYARDSSRMKTSLIRSLPKRQPYHVAPWNYPAATTVPHVDFDFDLRRVTQTIVDWVLVELRASAPGAGAGLATTGGYAAGLLLDDGRIAGINEDAPTAAAALLLERMPVVLKAPPGSDVYVLIHHRNHLPVITAQAAATRSADCDADYCADFRDTQSWHGCAQLRRADGRYMMITGDVNRSGTISWGDDDFLLGRLGRLGSTAYTRTGSHYPVDGDLNFDGRVSAADFQVILDNNLLSSAPCTP